MTIVSVTKGFKRAKKDRKLTTCLTGVNPPPGPPSARWYHRAIAQGTRVQVQLRQDDLPEVLRASAAPGDQLPQEEVRSHQPAPPEEEAEVDETLGRWMDEGRWRKALRMGVSLVLYRDQSWQQKFEALPMKAAHAHLFSVFIDDYWFTTRGLTILLMPHRQSDAISHR